MDVFLEAETPDELCRHLFLSFIKTPQQQQQQQQQQGGNGGQQVRKLLAKIVTEKKKYPSILAQNASTTSPPASHGQAPSSSSSNAAGGAVGNASAVAAAAAAGNKTNAEGRTLKEMAEISSKAAICAATPTGATAAAAAAASNNNNNENNNNNGSGQATPSGGGGGRGGGFNSLPSSIHLGLSERLHGLSEKLQALGGRGGGDGEAPRSRTSEYRHIFSQRIDRTKKPVSYLLGSVGARELHTCGVGGGGGGDNASAPGGAHGGVSNPLHHLIHGHRHSPNSPQHGGGSPTKTCSRASSKKSNQSTLVMGAGKLDGEFTE